MRSVDSKFYKSKAWNTVRKTIWIKQHCLCGLCGKPVYVDGISEYIPKENRVKGIVHHIEHLNNNNVYDDNITLNEDNLIGVCIDCHNQIHASHNTIRSDYKFDENGNVVLNEKKPNLLTLRNELYDIKL